MTIKFKHRIKALSLFANVGVAESYLRDVGVDVVVANELIENIMRDIMFDVPSNPNIEKCIITKEAVEGTGEPQIVHGEAPAIPATTGNAGRRNQRARKKGTPETA